MLVALHDVDNALAVYRTDQTHRDDLAQQAAFDLARESYRKGIVTFLYVQATTQIATDLVAPYKALGVEWEDAA